MEAGEVELEILGKTRFESLEFMRDRNQPKKASRDSGYNPLELKDRKTGSP